MIIKATNVIDCQDKVKEGKEKEPQTRSWGKQTWGGMGAPTIR